MSNQADLFPDLDVVAK